MKKAILLATILFFGILGTVHSQVCGGIFTDPAGPTANYSNNSNYTVTICPTNPGEQVTVTFTSFDIQPTADALYVYDGNTKTVAQIESSNPGGGFWGTALRGL
jgi:hypothetical protein